MSAVTIPDELEATALKLGITCQAEIRYDEVDSDLLSRVPLGFARTNSILPLRELGGVIRMAVSDAAGLLLLDELRMLFGKPIVAVLIPPAHLADVINHVYAGVSGTSREVLQELEGEDLSTIATELSQPQDLLDLTDEGPVIRLLATDVDIELSGRLRISARSLELAAREGPVTVSATDDVIVRGETIKLN